MICQKIGRICTDGLAVIIFPWWMNLARTSANEIAQQAEVDQVILDFTNESVDRCPHAINAGYWGDIPVLFDMTLCPCCNCHNPELDQKHLEEVVFRASVAKSEAKMK